MLYNWEEEEKRNVNGSINLSNAALIFKKKFRKTNNVTY